MIQFLTPFAIALIAAIIVYMVYRRISLVLWGFLAAFLPDLPTLLMSPLGATNLDNLLIVTHTIGLIVFPVILVTVDILLIEIGLLKYLKPFYYLLPAPLKTAVRVESAIDKLQHYHTIPHPERVTDVFTASLMAGIINLIISAGLIAFGIVLIL